MGEALTILPNTGSAKFGRSTKFSAMEHYIFYNDALVIVIGYDKHLQLIKIFCSNDQYFHTAFPRKGLEVELTKDLFMESINDHFDEYGRTMFYRLLKEFFNLAVDRTNDDNNKNINQNS